MSARATQRNLKRLLWPGAGVVAAVAFGSDPSSAPEIPISLVLAAWCLEMALVFVLSSSSIGARLAGFLVGLCMAAPSFVRSPPLTRGLLMVLLCMAFFAAIALLSVPPIAGLRPRLHFLCSWSDSIQVTRRPRRFETSSLVQLILATAVLDLALLVVKTVPDSGASSLLRWFAGGIAILACAEMLTACLPFVASLCGVAVPPLMQSPWRSTSVAAFWNKRWNTFAGERIFRPWFFFPSARYGVVRAMFVAFAASGVGHGLLALMALGNWRLAFLGAAFFLVQPLLILAERQLGVHHWKPLAGQIWTLSALAISSPLFVIPALKLIELTFGNVHSVLFLTSIALVFILLLCAFVSLASFASCPPLINRAPTVDRSES